MAAVLLIYRWTMGLQFLSLRTEAQVSAWTHKHLGGPARGSLGGCDSHGLWMDLSFTFIKSSQNYETGHVKLMILGVTPFLNALELFQITTSTNVSNSHSHHPYTHKNHVPVQLSNGGG